MNKPPQANRGFDQWVFYFRSGESISVAADEVPCASTSAGTAC